MTFGGSLVLLVPFYQAQMPGVRVATETPDNLQDVVPLLQVASVGGPAEPNAPVRFRTIRWVLHAFDSGAAGTTGSQEALALAERAFVVTMANLRKTAAVGCRVTYVSNDSGPAWVPYVDPAVRQYVASYSARIVVDN